jgi:spermidine/putrescine transport system ATP-binding protein
MTDRPAPPPGAAAGDAALLRLENVVKAYGRTPVLRGVSLAVAPNEFLTVIGPSGSGKTTVLRLIAGFERPDAGRVVFEGRDLAGVPVNRRPFNTVFQDYALFHHLTVRENVGFGLRVRGTARAAIARRVDEVLATVDLAHLGARYPAQLSGGQRQRVALARAIVCEPRVILLDEPLAALDVEMRAQMQDFLKELQRRLGIAFVFITHDQEEAMVMADRIVVVRDGRIEQAGRPEEIYRRPATPFVASFFGENNVFAGRVAASGPGGDCVVAGPFGPVRARLPGPPPPLGAAVHCAVRPEQIATDASGGENQVAARVERIRFLGANLLLECAAGGATLQVRRLNAAAGAAAAPGEPVTLSWPATAVAVIPGEAGGGA